MDITGVGAAGGMHAVSGASSSGPPQQKMSDLFDSIDTSGSGSITKSQFEQAFQSKNPPAVFQKQGADAIFAALDPSGTGSVSKQDFVSGMKTADGHAGAPTIPRRPGRRRLRLPRRWRRACNPSIRSIHRRCRRRRRRAP